MVLSRADKESPVRAPAHFVTAVERLTRAIAVEADAGPLVVVGAAEPVLVAAVERALDRPATRLAGTAELDAAPPPAVAVALDWLHRVEDPDAALQTLADAAPHLLLGAPREPLAALGVRVTSRAVARLGGQPAPARDVAWSAPGFVRFVSSAAAVRDVAHPFPWNLVWARRA